MIVARGCHDCNPQTDPRRHRHGVRHFSIDLAEVRTHNGRPMLDCMVTVTLDGEQVLDCAEVYTGPGGWARRFSSLNPTRPGVSAPRRCGCGSGKPEVVIDEADGYRVELPS